MSGSFSQARILSYTDAAPRENPITMSDPWVASMAACICCDPIATPNG